MEVANMNIGLERATKKDLEEILEFMRSYYAYEGLGFNMRQSKEVVLDLLSNDNYGFIDLILVDGHVDGHMVGYICITFGYSLEYLGRDCIIDEIYIVSDYQRIGIGSTVLKMVERQLSERGFKAVHLEVFAKNRPARGFFVKNGYTIHPSSFMSKIL
jgi:ribosomal protein S18 acetylase RimI-like enzyme